MTVTSKRVEKMEAIAKGAAVTIRDKHGEHHGQWPSPMDQELAQAWVELYEYVNARTGNAPMHDHGPGPL
jgi:hypothetical protein